MRSRYMGSEVWAVSSRKLHLLARGPLGWMPVAPARNTRAMTPAADTNEPGLQLGSVDSSTVISEVEDLKRQPGWIWRARVRSPTSPNDSAGTALLS